MRITAIPFAVLLVVSCGTARKAITTEKRDSTRVEVRAEYVERVDTVYVEIPQQAEKIVVKDTTSHLENGVAISDASIDQSGLLHHSLETKRQKLPAPVKTTITRKDSIVFRDKEVIVEKPVYIDRRMTVWQQIRLKSWWLLLALVGFAYRKEIFSAVRRFI